MKRITILKLASLALKDGYQIVRKTEQELGFAAETTEYIIYSNTTRWGRIQIAVDQMRMTAENQDGHLYTGTTPPSLWERLDALFTV